MCSGATSAATKPSRVAGATAGPASRLAGIATGVSCPDMRTSTGVTAAWAAAATAVASAAHRGIRLEKPIPPAGSEDQDARGGADRQGETVGPGEGRGRRRSAPGRSPTGPRRRHAQRPVPRATAATPPIRRARSTLGEGRATTAKASMASTASTARAARGSPAVLASATAAPATIARLAPETAVRWLRPGFLEIGSDLLVHARHVTDHQARQQTALGRWQHAGRFPQPRPEHLGRALHPRGPAQDSRRPPDQHRPGEQLAGVGRGEPPGDRDSLAGQQRTPLPSRGEQHHRSPQRHPARPRPDRFDPSGDHETLPSEQPAVLRQRPGIVGHHCLHHHRGPLLHQLGHRSRADRVHPEGRRPGDGGRASQHRHHDVPPARDSLGGNHDDHDEHAREHHPATTAPAEAEQPSKMRAVAHEARAGSTR